MKTTKFLPGIIALIVFFSLDQATAQQWANNGTHIYNTNTGNVGIGTGTSFTPGFKLHINNGSNTASIMCESSYTGTANYPLGYIRLKNTATGDMFNMVLRKNGTVHEMLQSCYDATAGLWREYAYYNYGTRKYEMRSGINDVEFMNSGNFLINSTGNVGIKTSAPGANLHVAEIDGSITASFGTYVGSGSTATNDITIGNDNGPSLFYIGQNSADKGFIIWNYALNPDNSDFRIGVYSGAHPLVLQSGGGNVGIHTSTPDASLDVYVDDNSRSRLGYTEAHCNFFYHNEDPADADGQAAFYARRGRLSESDGSDYGLSAVNCAMKGYNYWGDEYTFGTCGFSSLDYTRCGGILGASAGGTYWGSLGYKNSSGSYYGGYFTSYSSGAGKSSQSARFGIGIGAWGDLFGADIHGKIYGTYTEGENYALFSNGITYKNDLDVHLQENGTDTKTVLYTNTSTDVTVQTSGMAMLSNGKASIEFDEAFVRSISSKEPIIIIVTPIGRCNGVFLADVTGTGFSVEETNSGRSNVTVNYIAIGKRAGYENPRHAKEVIDAGYVNKLSRGLHNDNNLQTDGEGLYYENGKLIVGIHPSTLPDPNKSIEKISLKQDDKDYGTENEGGVRKY
jgi:hypothetical protein